MRNSLKKDILIVLFFTALIPTLLSTVLLVMNVVEQGKEVGSLRIIAKRQAQYALSLEMNQIEQTGDVLGQSTEVSSFIHAPVQLRRYTRDLLVGKTISATEGLQIISNVIILDKANRVIFNLNNKPLQSDKLTSGFNYSNGRSTIRYLKEIKSDDQFQNSASAVKLGSLVFTIDKAKFLEAAGNVEYLENLPKSSRQIDRINVTLGKSPVRSKPILPYIVGISLLLGATLFIGIKLLLGRVLVPIVDFTAYVTQQTKATGGAPLATIENEEDNEITRLRATFDHYITRLAESNRALAEQAKAKALSELARQVSHDIRSPLSALNLALNGVHALAEDHRVLIRNSINRINDIANTLLSRRESTNLPSAELIAATLDSIVSEKRMQYREQESVKITADFSGAIDAFTVVNQVELKRVISNLVNNSVESFKGAGGTVSVILRSYGNKIAISITDDGCGIPAEILAQLGKVTVTHEKKHGSGLGILHAKKAIERMGGSLDIQSKVSVGTVVSIVLPRSQPPEWFIGSLSLRNDSLVVVLDDDKNIHNVWLERFRTVCSENQMITVEAFINYDEMSRWLSTSQGRADCFLIDYELGSAKETGLDLIEKLQIANKSILVTSRYDEQNIRDRAVQLGVKILPKPMVTHIPIKII